jgi:hypothetical protein
MIAAAMTFGALILATPFLAIAFRDQLRGGGFGSLLLLLALMGLLLALSLGCLVLFLRAYRRAIVPPNHSAIEAFVAEPQRTIMRAFAFDPDDLAANRAGRLSERQRINVRSVRSIMLIIGAVMMGVTVLSMTWIPRLIGGGESGPAATGSLGRMGVWLPFGVVGLLVGGAFARGYWSLRDQFHGRLSVAEGEAALVQQQAGSATAAGAAGARTMQIGGVRLPMFDRAQRAALKAGVRYRVYYLRGPAPRVMAVELI